MFFAPYWANIQATPWVLRVVTEGYALEFTSPPPRHTPRKITPLPGCPIKRQTLVNEVQALVAKKAIYPVHPPLGEGFWSGFFLTPKKSGEWCSILNLKP
jgi:hypothetical protein